MNEPVLLGNLRNQIGDKVDVFLINTSYDYQKAVVIQHLSYLERSEEIRLTYYEFLDLLRKGLQHLEIDSKVIDATIPLKVTKENIVK